MSRPTGEKIEMSTLDSSDCPFESEDGDDEEDRLDKFCSSKVYKETRDLIARQMRIASMRLVAEHTLLDSSLGRSEDTKLHPEFPLTNILKPKVLLMFSRRGFIWLRIRGRLLQLAWLLFLLYLVIKAPIITYFLYEQNTCLKTLHPQLRTQARRTMVCALKEDIFYAEGIDASQYRKFAALSEWLRRNGGLMLGLPGVGVIVTSLICTVPVVYYYMPLVFFNLKAVKCDCYSFIFNPKGERKRIKLELERIVRDLIISLLHRADSLEEERLIVSYLGRDDLHERRMESTHNGWQICKEGPFIRIALNSNVVSINWLDNLQYINLLVEAAESVRPRNMTSSGLRIASHIMKFTKTTMMLVSYMLTLLYICSLIGTDIYEHVRHRLAVLECSDWAPDGVLIKDFLQLEPLRSDEDRAIYRQHDGSLSSFLNLTLMVEPKYYFTPNMILFLIEINMMVFMVPAWAIFYDATFLTSSCDKIIWLFQLERQLDWITRASAEHGPFGKDVDKDAKLLKRLTISYLNFELFRRQHSQYFTLSNFLLSQLSTLTGVCFIICYLVATNIETKNASPIIFAVTCIVSFFNLCHAISSYATKKVERLMRKVLVILANCSANSVHLSYPCELWRRQILSDSESNRLFASNQFGSYITYEKLISFNAYLLALWLLLLKIKL